MLPKAARIPHAMTLHGDTRIDNYYWLRDDTRSQPEVLDYLQQENSYGHRVMASQQALQDRILKEIIDRIPQREVSAPYIKNGYRYRHIYEPGCEYAIYQRQSAFSEEWDEWETLLDANKRAAHSEFYSMGGMAITPDNTIMALAEDFLSRRQYGIRFRNLETGNWYPELLDNVEPSFVWANDSWTFYYVRKHPVTLLPYQVWRHAIGTPASQDKLIYEEKDDTYYVSLHIRWAEWRLRQITPLWHWQKIFFPDGSTAFVFVIWKQVTGTRNCWITLNPALSGQMTPGLSTMFASIQ